MCKRASFSGITVIVLLAVLCVPAAATDIPYSEIDFFGATNQLTLQGAPPPTFSSTKSDSQGSGSGFVDLSTGTLKATATATIGSPGFTTIAKGVDSFVLMDSSVPLGTLEPITATLSASGTGLIPLEGESGIFMEQLGLFGAAQAFDIRVFQAFTNPTGPHQVPTDVPFNVSLFASLNFDVAVGTPFDFDYFIRLDTRDGDVFNMGDTAHLTFSTPVGAVLTSKGGFGSAAAVPEPSSFLLLGSGLIGLATLTRKFLPARGSPQAFPSKVD